MSRDEAIAKLREAGFRVMVAACAPPHGNWRPRQDGRPQAVPAFRSLPDLVVLHLEVPTINDDDLANLRDSKEPENPCH